jgi:hypothetical protein
LVGDITGGDMHTGNHAFDERNQGAAVRFTGGGPSQHGIIFPRPQVGTQSSPAGTAPSR